MMQVGYSGPNGDAPGTCAGAARSCTPPRRCRSIGGAYLHNTVLDELFRVLEPASLEATARAMADAEQRHRDQVAAFELALERARFEADRATRKHDEVEPEQPAGRPHPGTAWRGPPRRRPEGRKRPAPPAARHPVHLTSEELAWLTRAGADIRAVFDAPATTNSRAQAADPRRDQRDHPDHHDRQRVADLRITWQGTAHQRHAHARKGSGTLTTSEDTVTLVRRLARHYNDTTIARILARQHRRTATGLAWTRTRVKALRRCYGIPHCPATRKLSAAPGTMTSWPPFPRPRRSSAWTRPPSTGGCGTASSPASSSPPAPPGRSASPRPCAARSALTSRTAGCRWTRPPKCSAWPGRPCCTRSTAASSPPSTSRAGAARACVSRSNTTSLDCLTHHTERKAQC